MLTFTISYYRRQFAGPGNSSLGASDLEMPQASAAMEMASVSEKPFREALIRELKTRDALIRELKERRAPPSHYVLDAMARVLRHLTETGAPKSIYNDAFVVYRWLDGFDDPRSSLPDAERSA